jgi:DNA invertase Pin-like site-specific DNA recombinase
LALRKSFNVNDLIFQTVEDGFEREILRERVKAGIAQARARGQPHGRPPTVKARSAEIKRLFARGLSKREIAKRLKIGRTSVRRVLAQKDPRP